MTLLEVIYDELENERLRAGRNVEFAKAGLFVRATTLIPTDYAIDDPPRQLIDNKTNIFLTLTKNYDTS